MNKKKTNNKIPSTSRSNQGPSSNHNKNFKKSVSST